MTYTFFYVVGLLFVFRIQFLFFNLYLQNKYLISKSLSIKLKSTHCSERFLTHSVERCLSGAALGGGNHASLDRPWALRGWPELSRRDPPRPFQVAGVGFLRQICSHELGSGRRACSFVGRPWCSDVDQCLTCKRNKSCSYLNYY